MNIHRALAKNLSILFFLLTGILVSGNNLASPGRAEKTSRANGGPAAEDITIIDSSHYSQVFGEVRNYRIFLPKEYYKNPKKRFPVIYFFHGWSERYFGKTRLGGYDDGDDNDGDNIANFVRKRQVIVVKADGYNVDKDAPYNLRPYNIGMPENYRQFPIYFPELVGYIDGNYKTIPDRNHRAVSGLSMGGFMSFWIGGKYPEMISAIGNFCGSVEFYAGPRLFPVEYRHLDMYNNYEGMRVRLHYGDKDFIRFYHEDMNRVWTRALDNYSYKIFDAEHSTCGMGEMFDFLLETFKNPPPKPARWNHIDVYPAFSVWGYEVSTDRERTGYTVLEKVDKRGFRSSVRDFLPDGSAQQSVDVSITTAPIYGKNQRYLIHDVDMLKKTSSVIAQVSDENGRLKIRINGSIHEIGINKQEDAPNITIGAVDIRQPASLGAGRKVSVSVSLANKGARASGNVKAILSATRKGSVITDSVINFGSLRTNEIKSGAASFSFTLDSDTLDMARFRVTIKDGLNTWVEFADIPLKRPAAELSDFEIADGRLVTVSTSAVRTDTLFLGTGNGDGIANPGEQIALLIKDKGQLHRTFASSSDKYVNPSGVNTRLSNDWGNYDYVGGSEKYTVPLIASDCPADYDIPFHAEYWLPESDRGHVAIQRLLRVKISGKDQTPPDIAWVEVAGDNTIRAKVIDGSAVTSIKATCIPRENLDKLIGPKANEEVRGLETLLQDNGQSGDKAAGDNIFSSRFPRSRFGLYMIRIEASDALGNTTTKEFPGPFSVH